MKKIMFVLTLLCSIVLGDEYAQVRANVENNICKDSDFEVLDRLCKNGNSEACLDMYFAYSGPFKTTRPATMEVERKKKQANKYKRLCTIGIESGQKQAFYAKLGCDLNNYVLCVQLGAKSFYLKDYCQAVEAYDKAVEAYEKVDKNGYNFMGSREYLTSILNCEKVSNQRIVAAYKKACKKGSPAACDSYSRIKRKYK